MTSVERKEKRYHNRKQKRISKQLQRAEALGDLEDVVNFADLYRYGKQCCNGVRWKNSVQRFELHLFSGTAKRRRAVLEGTYTSAKHTHFIISERGKTRPIDAPKIDDRQIQKLITKKILLPAYAPSFIWNNGASLPGKGLHFSQMELKKDLHTHFRKYGTAGNIILVDFKQFFPSASHQAIYRRHEDLILNPALKTLADQVIANSPRKVGLPLGVEPSQVEMIGLPSALDNFLKCQLRLKGMGHYMDDYYILVPPTQNSQQILLTVIEESAKIGLTVNTKKTHIHPIARPFKYCQATYTLTDTGKVVVHGNSKNMRRTRRKIKCFKGKVEHSEMCYEDVWASVNGGLAYFKQYNDHSRVLKIQRFFYAVYGFSAESFQNFRKADQLHGIHNAQTL